MSYEAFILTSESRAALAQAFPPKFPLWIGYHITHSFGVPKQANVPYGEQTHGWFEVIGYAVEDGLEALVVRVTTKERRPDGKRYHVTWSLDPCKGKKPVHSNDLIAKGFQRHDPVRFDACFDYVD